MGDNSIVDLPEAPPQKEQEEAPEIVDLPEDKPKDKEQVEDEDPLDVLRGLKPRGGWSDQPWHVSNITTRGDEGDEGEDTEDEGEDIEEEGTEIIQKEEGEIIQEGTRERRKETPFDIYMREEHPSIKIQISPDNIPWLSFDPEGNVLLYSDPSLHQEKQLPDNIKAIQSQNGIVHTAFDPTTVNPKIHGFHNTAPPEMQHDVVTVQ
jgi:hypothetical protein